MCEYDSEQKTKIKKQKKMKAKCVVLQMSTSNKYIKKVFFCLNISQNVLKLKGFKKLGTASSRMQNRRRSKLRLGIPIAIVV